MSKLRVSTGGGYAALAAAPSTPTTAGEDDSLFDYVPDDLLMHMFRTCFDTCDDLMMLEQVCGRWRELMRADDQFVWGAVCERLGVIVADGMDARTSLLRTNKLRALQFRETVSIDTVDHDVVRAFAVSDDGRHAVCVGRSGNVSIVDLATHAVVFRRNTAVPWDNTLWQVHMRGKLALVTGGRGRGYSAVIDVEEAVRVGGKEGTLQMGQEITHNAAPIGGACICEYNGRTVCLTGGDDCMVFMSDVETGEVVRRFVGHPSYVWGLDVVGNTMLTTDHTGMVFVWSLDKPQPVAQWEGHRGQSFTGRICRRTGLLVTGGRDGEVKLWTKEGRLVQSFDTPTAVRQLALVGNLIVAVSMSEGTMNVLDRTTGERCAHVALNRRLYGVYVPPTADRVIACGDGIWMGLL